MSNPILTAINKRKPANNFIDFLKNINNPEQAARELASRNPQFADFYNKNKNKRPEDIAREYGVNLDDIYKFLK